MYRITLALLIAEVVFTFPGAHDVPTWCLEVFPVVLALPLVWHFGKRGALSPFLQVVIIVHGLILCVGGHYTYALVPPGDWVRDLGIGTRNNYDKLGHLMQGVTPALAIREILMRIDRWNPRTGFMLTLTVLAAGGISAFYEVLEMTAALLMGGSADAFLGTQGYVWDTQTDMAVALVGALLAAVLFAKAHERSIRGGTGKR
jgi:putative membrane protein